MKWNDEIVYNIRRQWERRKRACLREQNIKLHDFYSISIFNLLNVLYASAAESEWTVTVSFRFVLNSKAKYNPMRCDMKALAILLLQLIVIVVEWLESTLIVVGGEKKRRRKHQLFIKRSLGRLIIMESDVVSVGRMTALHSFKRLMKNGSVLPKKARVLVVLVMRWIDYELNRKLSCGFHIRSLS